MPDGSAFGVARYASPGVLRPIARCGRWATTSNSTVHQRIRELGYTVHFPLFLQLREREAAGEVESDEIEAIATTLESFFIRRIVVGWPTNLLYRLVDRICVARPTRRDDLIHTFTLTSRPIRGSGADCSKRRSTSARTAAMLMLQRVEADLRHLESHLDPEATVEHVMPRGWPNHWPLENPDLAFDEAESNAERRDRLIHTFGNLTLLTQALNSAVSNGPYTGKRPEITKQSALQLNAYLQDHYVWHEDKILERGTALFERALEIWPRPNSEDALSSE